MCALQDASAWPHRPISHVSSGESCRCPSVQGYSRYGREAAPHNRSCFLLSLGQKVIQLLLLSLPSGLVSTASAKLSSRKLSNTFTA